MKLLKFFLFVLIIFTCTTSVVREARAQAYCDARSPFKRLNLDVVPNIVNWGMPYTIKIWPFDSRAILSLAGETVYIMYDYVVDTDGHLIDYRYTMAAPLNELAEHETTIHNWPSNPTGGTLTYNVAVFTLNNMTDTNNVICSNTKALTINSPILITPPGGTKPCDYIAVSAPYITKSVDSLMLALGTLRDADGNPMPNVDVYFELGCSSPPKPKVYSKTDSQGIASTMIERRLEPCFFQPADPTKDQIRDVSLYREAHRDLICTYPVTVKGEDEPADLCSAEIILENTGETIHKPFTVYKNEPFRVKYKSLPDNILSNIVTWINLEVSHTNMRERRPMQFVAVDTTTRSATTQVIHIDQVNQQGDPWQAQLVVYPWNPLINLSNCPDRFFYFNVIDGPRPTVTLTPTPTPVCNDEVWEQCDEQREHLGKPWADFCPAAPFKCKFCPECQNVLCDRTLCPIGWSNLCTAPDCQNCIECLTKLLPTPIPTSTPAPITLTARKLCEGLSGSKQIECEKCFSGGGAWTALGCFSTDFASFVNNFYQYAFPAAGGIAFLLLIAASIIYMTSSGSEAMVTLAKLLFTTVFVGLLVIIFAPLFLKFILVDVLKIPLFSSGP